MLAIILSCGYRMYCVRSGLTQRQVAMRLGLGCATVNAYGCGVTSPRLEVLRRIVLLYRVSLDELMGLKPPNPLAGLAPEQKEFVIGIVEMIKNDFSAQLKAIAKIKSSLICGNVSDDKKGFLDNTKSSTIGLGRMGCHQLYEGTSHLMELQYKRRD